MTSINRTRVAGSLEAEARAVVETLGGTWRPGGGMCRCPAHDDRDPSLSVRIGDRRLLLHCFAGCTTNDVIQELARRGLLDGRTAARGAKPRSRRGHPESSNRAAAKRLWHDAMPIAGTAVEAYLAGRGLIRPSGELRFHPRTPFGQHPQVMFAPALIAAVRDNGGLVAVHRTLLDGSQECPKRSLGRLGEGSVRLWPPEGGVLGLAEGIETAMAATALTGIPCWAVLGANRFGRVTVPPVVGRLVLFLDGDTGGRRAEALARAAPHLRVLSIEARYPLQPGSDWNDVLIERQRQMNASHSCLPHSSSTQPPLSCLQPFGSAAAGRNHGLKARVALRAARATPWSSGSPRLRLWCAPLLVGSLPPGSRRDGPGDDNQEFKK